jgi:hypothetical protein
MDLLATEAHHRPSCARRQRTQGRRSGAGHGPAGRRLQRASALVGALRPPACRHLRRAGRDRTHDCRAVEGGPGRRCNVKAGQGDDEQHGRLSPLSQGPRHAVQARSVECTSARKLPEGRRSRSRIRTGMGRRGRCVHRVVLQRRPPSCRHHAGRARRRHARHGGRSRIRRSPQRARRRRAALGAGPREGRAGVPRWSGSTRGGARGHDCPSATARSRAREQRQQ